MKPSSNSIVLVAFGESDNLGVGYLLSVLNLAGFEAIMIDFRDDNRKIMARLKESVPLVVGFSVMYEVYIDEFARFIKDLRNNGINCHFTAGGSFASLHPDELFHLIPELDSIVRFEGEETFLELVSCLSKGQDWRSIRSIAFREDRRIIKTTLRTLEKDLDVFPFPTRLPLNDFAPGKKFATIIASRGCTYDCSFCNTREFYGTPGGPLKRFRKPDMVVSEMEQLYHEKGCVIFLFQDDDFPIKTTGGNEWIRSFCMELERKGLHQRILWKINCRPDEIDAFNFRMMKEHGLFLVFIGLEDGTDEGLSKLNKRLTVAKSIEGIEILKRYNIGFDYGFMLFQPDTTYKSLRENLKFLYSICSDGVAPIEILKLMPYFDTSIEKYLRLQGRIKGRPGSFDYNFLNESLDTCYSTISDCFSEWLWNAEGVTNMSRWARSHLAVYDFFGFSKPGVALLKKNFMKTASESNKYILDTLAELVDLFESGSYMKEGSQIIDQIKSEAKVKHAFYRNKIRACL